MKKTKADQVTEKILNDIETGYYTQGQELPAEADLADRYQVSRLTMREAIRHLAERGVLQVAHGRRNRLAPVIDWSLLDPPIATLSGKITGNPLAWALDLMEARHLLETGAAALAAQRISDAQLKELENLLDIMDSDAPVAQVVEADMEFHRLIFTAAGNSYLTATYRSLEEILRSVRQQTSASEQVRQEAQHWHRKIYTALEGHDADAARTAMDEHMQQTVRGIKETFNPALLSTPSTK